MITFKAMKMKEYKEFKSKVSKLDQKKLTEGDYDEALKMANLVGQYVVEWDLRDVDTQEILPLPSANTEVFEEMTSGQLQLMFTEFHNTQTKVPN